VVICEVTRTNAWNDFLLTHFGHVGAMMRPPRAEIMRKQSGGDDNDGSHRLETGGLHLRNRDRCGDVDGRDGGDGFAAQRMVGTTNGMEATPAVIASP
jgi:hypothetical protein